MARDLTTPIQDQITDKQIVTDGQYHVFVDQNGNIDLSQSYYLYRVSHYDNGTLVKTDSEKVFVPSMPGAFKTKLKELHNMVVTDADNKGLLQPGTDTDDF